MNFRQVALAVAAALQGTTCQVVNGALTTGTGNHDFAAPGFGTPDVAIIAVSKCTSLDTETAGIQTSVGIVTASAIACVANTVEDNVGTTNAARYHSDADFRTLKPSGTTAVADLIATPSLITDGVRLNVTDAADGAYLVSALLLKGVSVDLNNANMASGPTYTKSGLSFDPEFLFVLGADCTSFNGLAAAAVLLMGFAAKSGGQVVKGDKFDDSANYATGAMINRDDAVWLDVVNGPGSYWTASFGAGEYVFTETGAVTAALRASILALGGLSAQSAENVASPSGPGTVDYTALGETPKAIINSFYNHPTVDIKTGDDMQASLGFYANGVAGVVAGSNNFNVGTSDVWSFHSNTQYVWGTGEVSGRKNTQATVDSLLSTGVRLNYGTVGLATKRLVQAMINI